MYNLRQMRSLHLEAAVAQPAALTFSTQALHNRSASGDYTRDSELFQKELTLDQVLESIHNNRPR